MKDIGLLPIQSLTPSAAHKTSHSQSSSWAQGGSFSAVFQLFSKRSEVVTQSAAQTATFWKTREFQGQTISQREEEDEEAQTEKSLRKSLRILERMILRKLKNQ